MSAANQRQTDHSTALQLLLISDCNLETLGHYLSNDEAQPQLEAISAPFGQVFPVLLSPHSDPSNFALVWTSPDTAVPALRDALNGLQVNEDLVLAQV